MPPRHIHNLMDLMLGIARYYGEFDFVHRLLDSPWAKLFGKQHRRILHDKRAVELITTIFGVRAGCVSAVFANRITNEFELKGEKEASEVASEAVKILYEWDTEREKVKKGDYWFPFMNR